jgi:uncharacterized protein
MRNNSCENLGVLYLRGEGVAQDEKHASALFKQSCAGGEQKQPYSCGEVQRLGLGVPQDLARALSLFAAACKKSHWEPTCSRVKELEASGQR